MPISRCPWRTGRIWDDIGKQPYRSARALEPGREHFICERVFTLNTRCIFALNDTVATACAFDLTVKLLSVIHELDPLFRHPRSLPSLGKCSPMDHPVSGFAKAGSGPSHVLWSLKERRPGSLGLPGDFVLSFRRARFRSRRLLVTWSVRFWFRRWSARAWPGRGNRPRRR